MVNYQIVNDAKISSMNILISLVGGNCNACILEEMQFVTDGELRAGDGQFQLIYNPLLNSVIAGNNYNEYGEPLTKHDYYQKNKQYFNQLNKEYRETHKEEIAAQKKIYVEHREEIKEKAHIYYIENKERIAVQNSAKYY